MSVFCIENTTFWGVFVRCSQGGETVVTALLGLARVRKYSNLVHLVYSASTEQDECILDRKYEILGCICGAQSMGGNGELLHFWASRA